MTPTELAKDIIDEQRANAKVSHEGFHQLVAQPTIKQGLIEGNGQGIARRQPGDGSQLAAAGDEKKVSLVQQAHHSLALVGIILPVEFERLPLVHGKAIQAINPQRQSIVPGGLVDQKGAGGANRRTGRNLGDQRIGP